MPVDESERSTRRWASAWTRRAASRPPLTLTEKILVAHCETFAAQAWERGKAILRLRVDRVAMQDATAQMALLQFMQSGRERVAVPSTVHCDHLIRARIGRGRRPGAGHQARTRRSTTSCAPRAQKYGIGFWKPGAGIIHQVSSRTTRSRAA